jgi:hypothetical protein
MWAIQAIDETSSKDEAQQWLKNFRDQDAFLGGRVLNPCNGSGWRVQTFWTDWTAELPANMRRVYLMESQYKALGIQA